MIVVCAGSIKEYRTYLMENNIDERVAVYADPWKIRSMHFTEIAIVGTFMYRSDAHELLRLAESRVVNR